MSVQGVQQSRGVSDDEGEDITGEQFNETSDQNHGGELATEEPEEEAYSRRCQPSGIESLHRMLDKGGARWLPLQHDEYEGLRVAVDSYLYDRLSEFDWWAYPQRNSFKVLRWIDRELKKPLPNRKYKKMTYGGEYKCVTLCDEIFFQIAGTSAAPAYRLAPINQCGFDYRSSKLQFMGSNDYRRLQSDHKTPLYHGVHWSYCHNAWICNCDGSRHETQLQAAIAYYFKSGRPWHSPFRGMVLKGG